MTTFDRYLFFFFLKVLFVLFVAIAGLTMMVDVFTNLPEFNDMGRQTGSLARAIAEYYGIRLVWFFDRTSPLFCLLAAVFSIGWLHRTNEFTAVLAGGVPEQRIARPLIVGAIGFALLGVANRELLVPRFRDKLSRDIHTWMGDQPVPMKPRYDQRNHLLITGLHLVPATRTIAQPSIRLHAQIGDFGRQIQAESALHVPAGVLEDGAQRPAGYLLRNVSQPADIGSLPTGRLADRPVLFAPSDTSWLKPGECFLASDVDFEYLTAGTGWADVSSTAQLLRSIRNPSIDYGADIRVAIHKRFVQPILDVTLVLLGLPLAMGRRRRHVVVMVGQCIVMLLAFFLVVMASHAMGSSGYLLTPPQAAWLPVALFVPIAGFLAFPPAPRASKGGGSTAASLSTSGG